MEDKVTIGWMAVVAEAAHKSSRDPFYENRRWCRPQAEPVCVSIRLELAASLQDQNS